MKPHNVLKKLSFLVAFSFFGSCLLAQSIISGQVVDADTKLPLEGASVFCQNTTIGAVTSKEGTYKVSLNKGGYELIVSYTGYQSKRQNVDASGNRTINFELSKEDKSLGEVVIQASNEVKDGWEKYGAFFKAHFIGATPFAQQCELKNPEAVKFYYYKRSDKLKVLATEPLVIANYALGYTMHYTLDSFVYYYRTDLSAYRGNCLYQPMDSTAEQQAVWKANRSAVYEGSRLHFLRSYYDSTLLQNGFTIDLPNERSKIKFSRINPYDTSYYGFNDSTGVMEVWLPAKATIIYNKKAPETTYLEQNKLPMDVKVQVSYVDLQDAILVQPNGYFTDQKSWINQGYWSWKNLADQLPYDYTDEEGK
jgi:hypothetical protein